jgi:hypothetical protein
MNWKSILPIVTVPGIILVACGLFSSEAQAWSSVYETRTMNGTHHNLCRQAYRQLQNDPAFPSTQFPSLQAIIDEGGVDANALGHGLGPDDATRSAYSKHYYNPAIGRGRAPEFILDHFNALKMDLYHAPIRSGDAGGAQKASWLAHFVQDMTVPYHVLGMPANHMLNDQNAYAIIGPRSPQIRVIRREILLQRFREDRSTTGQNADWFEAWYYDGDSLSPVETGTHFAYEANAMFTQPADGTGHHPYWRNIKPADIFAKEIADSTREKVERRTKEAFDPASPVTAGLLGSAVRATYSVWRASFSGLRIALSRVTPVQATRDMYTVAVSVQNLTNEAAQNVQAAMLIGSGNRSMRQVSLGSLASLRPTVNSSVLITSEPVHLPNLNEQVILRIAGTFLTTPDSGQTQSPANVRQFLTAQPVVPHVIETTPPPMRFDLLGTVWDVTEHGRYWAKFTRIGNSNVFKATFQGHDDPTNTVTITISGREVTIERDQAPLPGDKLPRRTCTYKGVLYQGEGSTDLNMAKGKMHCNFFKQYNRPNEIEWSARILGQRRQ